MSQSVTILMRVPIKAPSLVFGSDEEENTVHAEIGEHGFRQIQYELRDGDGAQAKDFLTTLCHYVDDTCIASMCLEIERMVISGTETPVEIKWEENSEAFAEYLEYLLPALEIGLGGFVWDARQKTARLMSHQLAQYYKARFEWERRKEAEAEQRAEQQAAQEARYAKQMEELRYAMPRKQRRGKVRGAEGMGFNAGDDPFAAFKKMHSKKKGGRR